MGNINSMNKKLKEAFEKELQHAAAHYKNGQNDLAWNALARAHILGQFFVRPHIRVHWHMFVLGVRTINKAEILGQIPRLILAAPGSFFKKAPKGNTGLSSVGIFQPMDIPKDLEEILGERSYSKYLGKVL